MNQRIVKVLNKLILGRYNHDYWLGETCRYCGMKRGEYEIHAKECPIAEAMDIIKSLTGEETI